ncbi:3',5'-cyclic-nucleotide phosphodiesterase [Noviherbaspirillum aridicola]|uniref:cAMP phosphodiesterase class-II:metallo-beta-lactamase superfamily protein n=1 Tax=Noviherbaspirillum aridicola TaxID=2849687 RepID=A0ABQ4Q3Q9_9BURK|nr:3',5'-cyclic-nucleotide phosphodiesterase [Noviherbaspirillum aridicola]GIZ51430.1 cAMP phosphodiesterase class-II:metallo-beta-lactamase superfamily protein [Noviherbaspirillum aridicola]
MRLQVLGCAGGIGGRESSTTSLLVDDDILLDAGTGVASLDLDRLVRIDHVFLTHSHLDHVAGLAFLVDAVLGKREGAITVHASARVIEALKRHLFNWVLWPDFATIPDADDPILRWSEILPGEPVRLGGRRVSPHTVSHTVGSLAYMVDNGRGGFLFTGDMCSTPGLWRAMREESLLRKVIVDCSFPDADRDIADRSLHFCPATLLEDIRGLAPEVEVLIYHLKPGHEASIMRELREQGGQRVFTALAGGDAFAF